MSVKPSSLLNPGQQQPRAGGVGTYNMPGAGKQAMTQHLGRPDGFPGMMGQKPYSGNNGQNLHYMTAPPATDPWGGNRGRISGAIGDDGTLSSYILLSRLFDGEGEEESVIGQSGLAPLITTKYDVISVRTGRFNISLPVRWAPRGQTHGTSYNTESRAFTLTDYASGFEFALALLNEPDGAEILRLSLEQLNLGIRDHLIMEAYNCILSEDDLWSDEWVKYAKEQNILGAMTAEQYIARDTAQLGFFQKTSTPIQDLEDMMDAMLRPYAGSSGVLPDTIIVGPLIGRYLRKEPSYSKFYNVGNSAEAFMRGGPLNALQSLTKFKIHMVKPTLVNGEDPFDILNDSQKVGFFAVLDYSDSTLQACGGNKYTTASRSIRLFDAERDDFTEISLERAIEDSGRWDPETDYLRSMPDGDANFKDSFYSKIGSYNEGEHNVIHRFLGQQSVDHVKASTLKDIASSFFDEMDDLKATETSVGAVTAAINTLIAAKKLIENVPVSKEAADFISALVFVNRSKGTVPSPVFPNVEMLPSELDPPTEGAGNMSWANAGWQLPPFTATGPGFRMIRQMTTTSLSGGNIKDVFGVDPEWARRVAGAITIVEQFARYANGAAPDSAAINDAYTSPNMEKNYVDTFIDTLLGNYRAPIFGYRGPRASEDSAAPLFSADTTLALENRAAAIRVAGLNISAPYLRMLESGFTGFLFESEGDAATASAYARQKYINAELSSVSAASTSGFRIVFPRGDASAARFVGAIGSGRPIIVSDNGRVMDGTTESGLNVLKLAVNFSLVAATASKDAIIQTDQARAVMLYLLTQIDTSDEALISSRLDAFFATLKAQDPALFDAITVGAARGEITSPVSASILSAEAAVAFGNASASGNMKILQPAVTDRTIKGELRQIMKAGAAAKELPEQAFRERVSPSGGAASAVAAYADAATTAAVDISRYVLLPLTYSPRQFLEYFARAAVDRFLSFIPADPENFSQPASAARARQLNGQNPRIAALSNLVGAEKATVEQLPAYIIGEHLMRADDAPISSLHDQDNIPQPNARDLYLPALLKYDTNFKAQFTAITKIANPVLRSLALLWALTPPRLSALMTMMDKNIRVPFTVLAIRPSVILNTTGITACLAGGQNTVFAHPIGTYGANATQQLMAGVLSFSSMAVVNAPQSIVHLQHLLITGSPSGFGTRSASGGELGSTAAYTGNHAMAKTATETDRGDIYFLVEPANFNSGKGYSEIISAYGTWEHLQNHNGVAFSGSSGAHFYNVDWFARWFYVAPSAFDASPESVALTGAAPKFDNMVLFADTYQKFNSSKCSWETRSGAAKGPLNPSDVRPGLVQSWTSLTPMSALKVTLV